MAARTLVALVGVVLAYAGARKAVDFRAWMTTSRRQSVPVAIAAVIPVVEIILGAVLVGRGPEIWSMAMSTVLLILFTLFLLVQVTRGSVAPCACFGAVVSRPPRWLDVARNLVLIAMLVTSAAMS